MRTIWSLRLATLSRSKPCKEGFSCWRRQKLTRLSSWSLSRKLMRSNLRCRPFASYRRSMLPQSSQSRKVCIKRQLGAWCLSYPVQRSLCRAKTTRQARVGLGIAGLEEHHQQRTVIWLRSIRTGQTKSRGAKAPETTLIPTNVIQLRKSGVQKSGSIACWRKRAWKSYLICKKQWTHRLSR